MPELQSAEGSRPRVRRIQLWPTGLIGRVTFVLLATVGLVFCVNWFLAEQAENLIAGDDQIDLIAERISTDVRVLNGTPASQRSAMSAMLSTTDLIIDWRAAQQQVLPLKETPASLQPLRERLVQTKGIPNAETLQLHPPVHGRSDISGYLLLNDSSVVHFIASDILHPHLVSHGVTTALIITLTVLAVAFMLVRVMSTPLRALTSVADAVGSGPWIPLSETGPREVRHLAQAINKMQERISRLIADRTEALAAVSHDLRTPLARLRLRVGFLNDPEAQEAIEDDLDDMESMVDGVLAYLSGETTHEPARPMDLAVQLSTIADNASDQGRNVVYEGPSRLQVILPPLAMKRVFNNLVENAIHYAGSAVITLHSDKDRITVDVTDHGPGIPEADLGKVTTPFYRIESSRSRRTGGLGLGLAIVLREVERAKGHLSLENRPEGGLRVRVTFRVATRQEAV